MSDYITATDTFMAQLVKPGVRVARVGGSVRDEILGRPVKDADYVVFGLSLSDLEAALTGICLGRGGCGHAPLKLRDGRTVGRRVHGRGLGSGMEIALPRREQPRAPRPGENVHRAFDIVPDPSLTPEEDALRRDFTFNALYRWIEPNEREVRVMAQSDGTNWTLRNVTDPTGRGLYDLQHKLVNTTHPDSFRDDPLRTLRALRFVSTLGYDLGMAAEEQMREHAEAVTGLTQKHVHGAVTDIVTMDGGYAVRRKRDEKLEVTATSGTVLTEMNKLLSGDDVGKALRIMRDTGVMATLFPELAPMIGFEQGSKYHDKTTDEHVILALESTTIWPGEVPLSVRWALLFHDSGKPETAWLGADNRLHYYEPSDEQWAERSLTLALDEPKPRDHEYAGEDRWRAAAKRLNVPRELREEVATLIRHHMVSLRPRNAAVKVRRARVKFGDDVLRKLYMHRLFDVMGKGKISESQVVDIGRLIAARREAEAAGVPCSVKDLQIGGRDVMELGVKGKAIGAVLAAVLDEVACDPSEQKRLREWQLSAAERHAERAW